MRLIPATLAPLLLASALAGAAAWPRVAAADPGAAPTPLSAIDDEPAPPPPPADEPPAAATAPRPAQPPTPVRKARAKPAARAGAKPPLPGKAAETAAQALPSVLQEVEAKYAKAETMQAEFTQVVQIAALKTTKTSSGVIMFKRPDKLRWETTKPDMNLLVSDGRRVWNYTPPFDEGEHGQVIVKKPHEINSQLANALLSGRFSAARDMKIRQENATQFLLIPRKGTAGTVTRAEIEVDPSQGLIRKVILDNRGGNRSEITLSKIELGKKIGDDAFVFDPPPGTDTVE